MDSAAIPSSIESMAVGNHDPNPRGIAPRQHESSLSSDGMRCRHGGELAATPAL
jgi:hypothetical protein